MNNKERKRGKEMSESVSDRSVYEFEEDESD